MRTLGGFRDYQAGVCLSELMAVGRQYGLLRNPFSCQQETSPVEGLGVYDLLECFYFSCECFDSSLLVAVSFAAPRGDAYGDDNQGDEPIRYICGM